jgi:hypothetical protein
MREIKFRAWNKIDKVMFSNHLNSPRIVNGVLTFDEDDVLMQFTGLSDKNGKDIYEGDIVLLEYNYLGKITVCFLVGSYNISRYATNKCRILGNIHQNPELVE